MARTTHCCASLGGFSHEVISRDAYVNAHVSATRHKIVMDCPLGPGHRPAPGLPEPVGNSATLIVHESNITQRPCTCSGSRYGKSAAACCHKRRRQREEALHIRMYGATRRVWLVRTTSRNVRARLVRKDTQHLKYFRTAWVPSARTAATAQVAVGLLVDADGAKGRWAAAVLGLPPDEAEAKRRRLAAILTKAVAGSP